MGILYNHAVNPSNPSEPSALAATLQHFIDMQRNNGPILAWSLVVGAAAGVAGALFRLSITGLHNGLGQLAHEFSAAGLPTSEPVSPAATNPMPTQNRAALGNSRVLRIFRDQVFSVFHSGPTPRIGFYNL